MRSIVNTMISRYIQKNKVLWLVALVLIVVLVTPVIAIGAPPLQRNKDIVVRGGDHGLGNQFAIVYTGTPSATYDIIIMDSDGITPPEIGADINFQPSYVSKGHWKIQTNTNGIANMQFTTTNLTSPKVYTFKVIDPSGKLSEAQINVEVVSEIVVPTMIPTTVSTPATTPSSGSIVIASSPAGATIFLDNALKGITPLTLDSVPNGIHTILIRLDGYQSTSKVMTVTGDANIENLVLSPIPTQTPAITTMTTGTITTQLTPTVTTTATTATPRPTAKVNYSATIATMQSQIAEQNTKIEEQGSWIDQILKFLGLK